MKGMAGRRRGRDEEHERDEADGWGASLRQLVLVRQVRIMRNN